MPQRDLKNNIQVVHLGALLLSGTNVLLSAWVDTRGFDSCTFVQVNGVVADAGAAAGFSATVEDSVDSASANAEDVDDVELIGLESALTVTSDTADNVVSGIIGYKGAKRYCRISITGTTGSDALITILAILERGSRMPDEAGIGVSVAAT